MKIETLIQSPNDTSLYQAATLDNGLRVLLVEQADCDKSAAAMAVNVGHFDDPSDREGLAHFLEHLLFLGSKHYPIIGDYSQFMASRGGSHNAWTGTEHSCFYFDVDDDSFVEALERFADFLSAPCFHLEAVERERHAIEAEFSMKLKDDGRRIYQAHKETVNPAHPFAKFSVGNLQTLDDRSHQTAQQAVQQFYQQQYAASRMTLCVVSALPLSEQLAFVQQAFAGLPCHLPAKTPLQEPLYRTTDQGLMLTVEPHKPSQRFVASFALPDIQPWSRYKIISLLAHLMGDEGPGSLLSTLKAEGLVNGMSAGGGIDGSNYKDFTLAFDLTNLGVQHTERVLSASFAYIALLKQQPFPWHVFEERQRLMRLSFLYQEPKSSLQLASDLAVNMQHYPAEDYLYGDYRMEPPTQTLYQEILSYFHGGNVRTMLIAPDVPTEKQARWYHTPYAVSPLPASLLDHLTSVTAEPSMAITKPNPYLVEEVQLLATEMHQADPVLLRQGHGWQLWYKADTEFNSPKGHVFVQVTLPNSVKDLAHLAQTKLWLELVLDAVNERLYPATTAGLSYNVYAQQHGITVHTSGLSANQAELMIDLLSELRQSRFDQERFEELKFQLCRHWQNQSRNKAMSVMFNQLSSVLQPLNPDSTQLAAELEALSFDAFSRFVETLFVDVHVEALALGNWSAQQAENLANQLQHWLQSVSCAAGKLPRQSFNLTELGPVWLEHPLVGDDQAFVAYLPSRKRDPLHMALFMLANHMISPEYFHKLRTEQQVGYLVGTGYVPMNLNPGLAFYVQSPHKSPAELYLATLEFYQGFLAELPTLSDDEFDQYKQSLISQIREKDTSLAARAKRTWLAIGQDDPQCQLSGNIIAALEQLSLNDFYQFCCSLLDPSYDAIFVTTGPKPSHSHMQAVDRSQLRELLATRKVLL